MKVLIACEESQTVCKEFRELGHEAYSNDIQECSGGHPEWHLNMDCFQAIELMDWDLMIAHPPCTYLCCTANRSFLSNPERWKKRLQAIEFVWQLMQVKIKHWAIENPKGVISSHIRKPDQYIQPYYFGYPESKQTGLWLYNLPKLEKTNLVIPEWKISKSGKRYSPTHWSTSSTNNPENSKIRSRTFSGIAQAMAAQWSKYIIESSGT